MNPNQLRQVWEKTSGHCHFCGDSVKFEHYGKNGGDESWVLDHIFQRGKGGSKSVENCLAACNECNRRRWHYSGEVIRDVLLMGVIARKEMERPTAIGKILIKLKEKRLAENAARSSSKKASGLNPLDDAVEDIDE